MITPSIIHYSYSNKLRNQFQYNLGRKKFKYDCSYLYSDKILLNYRFSNIFRSSSDSSVIKNSFYVGSILTENSQSLFGLVFHNENLSLKGSYLSYFDNNNSSMLIKAKIRYSLNLTTEFKEKIGKHWFTKVIIRTYVRFPIILIQLHNYLL